ncbi:MAG: 6-carboxytetrahydropterin synthase [Gemmatimonadaceae bacterium]|nr:6-carboxytetrahydropterin synthase [Gemmatimonadaceae bacterium]
MSTVSLTRRVTFGAAHRYHRAEWSAAQNEAAFGKCARLPWHGHSYVVDVTVRGEIDPQTGMCVSLAALDAALAAEVVARWDHQVLNTSDAAFAEGAKIPTCEEMARLIAERVQPHLAAPARVTRVTVAESDTLSATWET